MSASDVQILPGNPRPGVNVAALESDWEALWSVPGTDGKEAATMQVRTLNLLAPAFASDQDRVMEELQPVLLRHPSRAIVILHGSVTVTGLTSRATGICRTTNGSGARMCCEEAVIEAGEVPVERIVQAATPLLLPDLPTFLWWQHSLPVESGLVSLFDGLAGLSQRVVVDSAHSRDACAALELLSGWVENSPFRLSDCNWSRLTPWRELTARLFDPPRCRTQMRRIREIHVDCIASEDIGAQTLALLYVGWLASRLGWKVGGARIQPEGLKVTFAAGDETIQVSLGIGCGEQTGLRNVRLVTGGAEFQIRCTEEETFLRAESLMAGERRLVHAVPFRPPEDAALLMEELNLAGRDAIYEQALRQAATILHRLT